MFDPSIDPLYPILHHMLPSDNTHFHPYSPNEVKHRRRTTTFQLQHLEAVFTVDTKPNATRRNELAAQLGMSSRGVQVWFQNRRAKEKNKFNKKSHGAPSAAVPCPAPSSNTDPTSPNAEHSPKEEDELDAASPPPATPKEELLEEPCQFDLSYGVSPGEHFESPSPSMICQLPLRVVTDPASSATSWKPLPPDQTPPDSAALPSQRSIHDQRRASLPPYMVNSHFRAIPVLPQSIDFWDTHDRRRSVDVGLQRLGKNPFAEITRTRNAVLNRQSSLSGRKSSLRRPFLPPSSKYLDVRRASMDPRSLMPSRSDGLSPSTSYRPLHPVRASLPDTSLYTTPRKYVRELSGPLPAPDFRFGAASTTQNEPVSPDLSSYSFPVKDDTTEDDDVISSISSGALSRFDFVTSNATSESSVFSKSSLYDMGDIAPDQERRSSSGSVGSVHQLPNMTAGTRLDGAISPLQNPNPYRGDTHLNKGIFLVPSARLESQTQVHGSPLATSSFSSPASTPSLNGIFTTHSCTPSASISVSNSFEFVTALRSVSASPQISNGNALSSDALKLLEQREQQSPGRSIQVDSPPNEQQFIHGHQCQAIEGDDGTEPRISTILRNDQSDIPNSVASQLAAVSLPGNERYESVPFQDRSPLTGSGNQLSDQSECPAHYLGLMGNL